MEFWGVEVKAGEPVTVMPDIGQIIHISQAAMGDGKKGKGNDLVPLHVKINGKKLVVGSLSRENFPQITFDLVFEKKFELSHDWKNGSVYFCGYMAANHFSDGEYDYSEESDEDEDAPQDITENGKIEPKVEDRKRAVSNGKAAKAKVTVVEPKKDDESDESDEDYSKDEDMINASDDIGDSEDEDDSDDSEDEDDSDDSEDEDEETPKKAVSGTKRPTKSAIKTPVAAKKAKLDTPQKTDGKKGGGHTATPHPSKKTGKTTPNSSKPKEQTPKSEGKISCKSCTKTFTSGTGLESHTKAKHGGK